jgi:hypothetical protein
MRRGARNYAEVTSENQVHMLENFAASTAPPNPLQGQLWFNSTAGSAGELMLYDTNNAWIPAGNPFASGLANPVNIGLSGDATGSVSFNGTTNVTIPVALSVMPGLAAGTYVSPTLTINTEGRITAASGSALGANAIISALGYVPANDALVVHKAGDTMTGTLTVNNADVNTTGTGLIKENGFALVPSGFIGMWSGSPTNIPGGWNLCDGTNGTPNLSGRFIVATGGDGAYTAGQSGGTNLQSITTSAGGTHSHVLSIVAAGIHNHLGSTDGYALTINNLPPHTHPYGTSQDVTTGVGTTYASGGDDQVFDNQTGAVTGSTGSGVAHAHPIEFDGTHTHTGTSDTAPNHTHNLSFDGRPEYYALAYIMKL